MKFNRLLMGGLGLSVLAVLSACAFNGKEITHIDFKKKTLHKFPTLSKWSVCEQLEK